MDAFRIIRRAIAVGSLLAFPSLAFALEPCTSPMDLTSGGAQVGQVTANLVPATKQLSVSFNLNPGYTFAAIQGQGGLSSEPPSTIFPLNSQGLPNLGQFSAQSHFQASNLSNVQLVLNCSQGCSFNPGDHILLGLHATIQQSGKGQQLETWSAGQPFNPSKGNPATYSSCVVDEATHAGPIDAFIYDQGILAKKVAPHVANLLSPATATGLGLSLPPSDQPGAAAGIVTAPAKLICSDINQYDTYGQIYFIQNGQKVYLAAAVPAGVPPGCQPPNEPNTKIATVFTETDGEFAGYFSVNYDLFGQFNGTCDVSTNYCVSSPQYFDYKVVDEFGRTSMGTVQLTFGGGGIPVTIDLGVQAIISLNQTTANATIDQGVTITIPQQNINVLMPSNATSQVSASGQSNSTTGWAVVIPQGAVGCSNCTGPMFTSFSQPQGTAGTLVTGGTAQLQPASESGAACIENVQLEHVYQATCSGVATGPNSFASVNLVITSVSAGGTPTVTQSPLQSFYNLTGPPCPVDHLNAQGYCCTTSTNRVGIAACAPPGGPADAGQCPCDGNFCSTNPLDRGATCSAVH